MGASQNSTTKIHGKKHYFCRILRFRAPGCLTDNYEPIGSLTSTTHTKVTSDNVHR